MVSIALPSQLITQLMSLAAHLISATPPESHSELCRTMLEVYFCASLSRPFPTAPIELILDTCLCCISVAGCIALTYRLRSKLEIRAVILVLLPTSE